jgi:hypothetical protein
VQGEGPSVETTLGPGPHRLRVTAEGRRPYEGSPDFQLFPARLEVSLAPSDDGGILAARGILGSLAIAGLVTASVFMGLVVDLHEQNQSAPTEENASALGELTVAVDVSWAATAALGGLALVFLAVDGGGRSTATFSVSPTPGGASLSLRGSLGGVL